MALADFLQALLRQPGGPQNALAQAASDQGSAGPNGSAAYQNALQAAFQAQGAPQQPAQGVAPQTTGSIAPAPQGAPTPPPVLSAPASGGNGLSGLFTGLQSLFNPQAAARNQTADWLQRQGMDAGTATLVAGNKPLLNQYLASRMQGNKPLEVNGKLVDPKTYKVLADFSNPSHRQTTTINGKLIDTDTGKVIGDFGSQREIRNDANGVPRYTDTGEAVYPSDQSASAGTQFFSGRGVEAQGLNYLIDKGVLTKEQAANVAAGKSVTGPNGEIIFMTPQGIFQKPAQDGSAVPAGPQGSNIPVTGPKYSEDMRKAGGFAMRADAADKIISNPAIGAAGTSLKEHGLSNIPYFGNYLVSGDYQQSEQAQRNFVNAVLRRESGAAISASEFENARKQYFPQPGDGPDVLKQKAENRKLAVESLRQSANPVPSFNGSSTPDAPSPQTSAHSAQGDLTGDKPPAGWGGKPELWQYMSPKDRALWMK